MTEITPRMTTDVENDVQTPDQIMPRYEPDNPYKWSNSTLAKREREVIQMQKDYPKVPPMWCYWLWDMNEKAEPGEIKKIIDSGEWEKEGKFANPPNGLHKEAWVYKNEEELAEWKEKTLREPAKLENKE